MSDQFICRLCLQDCYELFEVCNNVHKNKKIDEVISFHCHIEIKENDILNKVCADCWHSVEAFHDFYMSVQKSQENITALIESRVVKAVLGDKEELGIIVFDGNENDNIQSINHLKSEITTCELNMDELKSEIPSCELNTEEHFTENCLSDTEEHIGNENSELKDSNAEYYAASTKQEHKETVNSQYQPVSEDLNNDFIDTLATDSVEDVCPQSSEQDDSDENIMKPTQTEESEKDKEIIGEESSTCSEEFELKKNRRKRARRTTKEKENSAKKEKEEKIIEEYYKLQCDICKQELQRYDELCSHYVNAHKIRGFIVCCSKKFFRRSVIAEHVLRHTNPDLFKCSVCNKIYADKRCLNNHMLAHAPPDMKLFKCDHCPKSFVKKFKLEQHKLSHLTPQEKKHICDECDKPYASDALLRAHKRVVHEKTYAQMCEICAKVFNSRTFFEKHQLEHLGKSLPRVQCKLCDAWMKNEHTMRAHMRLHQDEGFIHKCDICGKEGPSANAILKHKRFVHLSERKFKCTLCEKAFKRAITLKEHMTVHTGEVLYTCTFCPKTFNSSANMHAHRKKAHPLQWEEEKKSKSLFLKTETIS